MTTTFARQVLERDGPNELKPPKGTPEYVKFARQLAGGLQCLMWVAAVICFIAFGIELARGNVTCFDNVSYISVSDRDRDKEREDSRLKQSLLAACFYGYIFLPPAVLGHHPHCCCCGNWLLWLLSRVQEYQHHSQLQEPGATGQLHITNKKVNVHTQLECINKGLYAIISLLISFTASYCDPRRPEKPDQRL